MKKTIIVILAILCVIGLFGCAFSKNLDTISDKMGSRMNEKVSDAVGQAKEEMVNKAEETFANRVSQMKNDMLEKIGMNLNSLVEYKPGIWFEKNNNITYENNGIKMNAFWINSIIDAEKETIKEVENLEIVENKIFAKVPEGTIVTISFFENLPEKVILFVQDKEVKLSTMENPLTGKSTHSFLIEYGGQETIEYVLLSEFIDLEDGLLELIFCKE